MQSSIGARGVVHNPAGIINTRVAFLPALCCPLCCLPTRRVVVYPPPYIHTAHDHRVPMKTAPPSGVGCVILVTRATASSWRSFDRVAVRVGKLGRRSIRRSMDHCSAPCTWRRTESTAIRTEINCTYLHIDWSRTMATADAPASLPSSPPHWPIPARFLWSLGWGTQCSRDIPSEDAAPYVELTAAGRAPGLRVTGRRHCVAPAASSEANGKRPGASNHRPSPEPARALTVNGPCMWPAGRSEPARTAAAAAAIVCRVGTVDRAGLDASVASECGAEGPRARVCALVDFGPV